MLFRHLSPSRWLLLPALCLALVLTGCEDESLLEPDATDDLFDRYVAIGNSITAGFQSGGITGSTQLDAFPVLLADAMDTEFNIPLLNEPGCPPPLVNPLTGERAANVECALRATPIPETINNAAVPGARVLDALTNLDAASASNALTTFLLGGRTQLEVAADVQPTFATVWLGNNDVLGAALAGNPDLLTADSDFRSRFTQVLDELEALGVQGGVLIDLPNVTAIPNLSPGGAYAQAKAQGALPPTFTVAANCAGDGAQSLVPFAYGFGQLLAQASGGQAVTLDCLNDPAVLTPAEAVQIVGAVQAFNAFIQDQAAQRGWAFVSANDYLGTLRANGQIPLFPNVGAAPQIFGAYFSLDGVHPSSLAHEEFAALIADAINAQYGTSLSTGS